MIQVLGGDIGGTQTRLQLAQWDHDTLQPGETRSYPSADYADLVPIVERFVGEAAAGRIDAACFAVAGPVVEGSAQITNLPWRLSTARLRKELAIAPLRLVNDFEGAAWGLDALGADELVELQGGEPPASGLFSQALVGAGTGFGQALIVNDKGHKQVLATEGGHVDFAARDEEELALWQYLRKSLSRISYETLLSGRGLVRLFSFYCEYLDREPAAALLQAMSETDPARVISEFALAGRDAVAQRALQRFVRIYGAQAGNVALASRALGGVFIGGGIAPKILPAMQGGEFMQAFLDKAPMQDLLRRMPVRLVTNPHLGLRGALVLAARGARGE